jgi:hypothetical protein
MRIEALTGGIGGGMIFNPHDSALDAVSLKFRAADMGDVEVVLPRDEFEQFTKAILGWGKLKARRDLG